MPDEKFHEVIAISLRDIKHTLLAANCANCTLYVFNADLQKSLSKFDRVNNPNATAGSMTGRGFGNLTMQKFAMEGGKWIDGICEMDREIGVPAFKKAEDVKGGIKSH